MSKANSDDKTHGPRRRVGGPQGFYAGEFDEGEREAMPDEISLADEQRLLRTRILRLARSIPLRGSVDRQLRRIETLLHMMRTLACLERTRAAARGSDNELADTILEALGKLDPDEEL